MSNYKERYTPTVMAANATAKVTGSQLGGFLAVTAGTITITDENGTAVLTAFPCAAGQYVPLPILLQTIGGTVVLAGGASGTLLT